MKNKAEQGDHVYGTDRQTAQRGGAGRWMWDDEFPNDNDGLRRGGLNGNGIQRRSREDEVECILILEAVRKQRIKNKLRN